MNPQDFWRIYRQIYRRRWLSLAIFASSFGVVVLGCIFMPRYYRASAYVMPSETALSRPVIPGEGLWSTPAGDPRTTDPRTKEEKMATLVGLAQTGEVRQRTIRSLGLQMTPEQLGELAEVVPTTGSIIRINALARTPGQAVPLANEIAHQFADYYRDLTSFQARRSREFLQSELAKAQAERQRAKDELQAFKAGDGEAALPVGTEGNPFLSQFYQLRSDIANTRSRLRSTEGRIGAINSELARQSPTVSTEVSTTDNPVTRQLQDELARLQRELSLAQSRYTEKHRKVTELKAQIVQIRQQLSQQTDRMITNRTVEPNPVYQRLRDQLVDLKSERAALQSQLSALAAAMSDSERRAGRLADSSVLLIAKTREYEEAQARYERLKGMVDEARVGEKVSSNAGEIQVVDEAKSAAGPVMKKGPSPWQVALVGLVLSLGLSLGTVLTLAYLDDRVQGRGDLRRELDLPVPAVIPELTAGSNGVPLGRITELLPLSPHAEAYRFLRTELMHHSRLPRTLLVATARPGHGGTTTAANLAIALAEVGNRVVLVDADLRRPSLHKLFGHTNDAGLTSLLANGRAAADRALRQTEVDKLLLLPAGPPVANPAALLSSDRMRALLAQLREHCDYVVIDTPSAATFADAAMLGPLVDGVLLVMRASEAVREAEHRTKELFEKVGANVVGVVLNSAVPRSVDSYYFHHHYYPIPKPALPPGREASDGGGRERRPRSLESPGARTVQLRPWSERKAAAAQDDGPAAAPQTSAPRSSSQASPWLVRVAMVAAGLLVLLACGSAFLGVRSWRHAHPAKGGKVALAGPSAAAPAAVTVLAVVKQPLDVRVQRDGQLLYEGPLTAGQQIWQGAREVTVWASRPEAIELSLNGKPVPPLGRRGDPPASRRFTLEEGRQ